jgi:hypothetical protein
MINERIEWIRQKEDKIYSQNSEVQNNLNLKWN